MDFSSYNFLKFKRNGRILTVTLNNPESLNAIAREPHREIARVFAEITADEESDVIILTGAGKAFCAGGDLEFMEECIRDPSTFNTVLREARTIINCILDCDKPIICRMNGDAVGLGATLALFCDIIIANDSARIGDPHVRVGLVTGDGGALIWPQLIGYARAKQYLLTGDLINAGEAQQMGLINFAVPASELDDMVNTWANRLANGTTNAIRWSKATINTGLKQLAGTIMDTGIAYEGMSSQTEEHRAAVAAIRARQNVKAS